MSESVLWVPCFGLLEYSGLGCDAQATDVMCRPGRARMCMIYKVTDVMHCHTRYGPDMMHRHWIRYTSQERTHAILSEGKTVIRRYWLIMQFAAFWLIS